MIVDEIEQDLLRVQILDSAECPGIKSACEFGRSQPAGSASRRLRFLARKLGLFLQDSQSRACASHQVLRPTEYPPTPALREACPREWS